MANHYEARPFEITDSIVDEFVQDSDDDANALSDSIIREFAHDDSVDEADPVIPDDSPRTILLVSDDEPEIITLDDSNQTIVLDSDDEDDPPYLAPLQRGGNIAEHIEVGQEFRQHVYRLDFILFQFFS
jgi:hypothetical protein